MSTEYPIGIALGTVKSAVLMPTNHTHCVHMSIHCDDVRWLGYMTEVYMEHRHHRLRNCMQVLHAHDLDSLIGRQGRFVYDVWYMYGKPPTSVLSWGMPRPAFAHAFTEYAKTCTPEQIDAIKRSPGVLPYEPETARVGAYR